MTQDVFNNRLRQILLLSLIIFLFFLMLGKFYVFLPGLLGGITLYILSRATYFSLIFRKKWSRAWTALLFILFYLVIISLPVYLSIELISPKINAIVNDPQGIMERLKDFSGKIQSLTGFEILSVENTREISQKISVLVPRLLNSTANVLANLLMMFFLLYYLLVNGRDVERYLNRIIPLAPGNVDKLASETKLMIKANALGIPIICMVQGAFAALGYFIFDVKDWAMWGFVTGIFAFFPLVGTMIVWVPLVIYLFSLGENWNAIALTIYSIVVTGNVDYLTRLGLMKRMGNVHPVITVLGVIIGLGLFGFVGLIFGPLLVSYFIVLVKIYMNEFTRIRDAG